VPARLAAELGLKTDAPASVLIANGAVTVCQTRLPSLAFGPFEFRDVAGHLSPGMQGDGVLLGMSALRHLEFTRRGDMLTLRAPDSG
jgi:aspartyl protease family protein